MKDKLHYIVEAALAVAVLILFILNFSGKAGASKPDENVVVNDNESVKHLPIAYVDVDSLMSNYNYSIDLNEQIAKKYENSKASLTEKLRKLQADAAEFQRKAETNAFLSRERAEAEQQRILKKQDELQKLEAEYTQDLAMEQNRMNEELRSTIISQMRKFNSDKRYQIIFGKMNDNILFADGAYNITAEVIEFLNKSYQASPVIKPE
jgi:outer membrane protein